MAWRPPMAPKSMPYWKGLIETRVHARRHFQFSSSPLVETGMLMMNGKCLAELKVYQYHQDSGDACCSSQKQR
jgi:hypothetical protein